MKTSEMNTAEHFPFLCMTLPFFCHVESPGLFFLQNQKIKLWTVNLTKKKMEFKSCSEEQQWLIVLGLKLPLLIIVLDNSVISDQK